MNLIKYIDLEAGGPGSGCKGPTCGRKKSNSTEYEVLSKSKDYRSVKEIQKGLKSNVSEKALTQVLERLVQERKMTKMRTGWGTPITKYKVADTYKPENKIYYLDSVLHREGE